MPELRRSTRVARKAEPTAPADEPIVKKAKKATQPKVAKPKAEPAAESESLESEIEVGDAIPDLILLDEDENEINLTEAAKKTKYLVIFAYPKASTPGCTRQVCGFQANYEFLKASNTTVFGLSADQPKAQKNFVVKQKLEYPLLSDPSKKLIGPLGAKKSPSGIKRSHWIFVDGVLKVKKIQISPEASITTAKEDIENFIKESENGNEEKKPKEEENGADEKEE